jgi:hypothetical protein
MLHNMHHYKIVQRVFDWMSATGPPETPVERSLALRIVRRLPACGQLSDPWGLMGRCWAIIEGGNRGNVLMSSAVAVRHGD